MVDEILRGLIAEPMEQLDPFITKEITNHLFEDNKKSFSGMDLIALNLHRGRDHGLPGYNAYRAACNLPKVSNFADLQSEIPVDVISRLQHVRPLIFFNPGIRILILPHLGIPHFLIPKLQFDKFVRTIKDILKITESLKH
jgi:hypothetical protein